jgi:hypothetical protein
MSMKSEAEACASKLPVGFVLMAVVPIFEMIYYGFEAWNACHQAACPTATASDLPDLAKAEISKPSVRRRARHRLGQINRRHQAGYTPDQLDVLTETMLNHVDQSPTASLVSCFHEPVPESQYEDETD